MLVVAAALLLTGPDFPSYRARFVDMHDARLGGRNSVADAAADLSLVGYTYDAMIDVIPAYRLCILGGKPCGMEEQNSEGDPKKQLWPFRILGKDSVLAQVGDYPIYENGRAGAPYVRARRSGNALRVVGRFPSPTLPKTRVLPFVGKRSGIPVQPWALHEVKRLSTAGYENHSDIAEAAGPGGLAYVNYTYYPITPGYEVCMHDAEQVIPAVRRGNAYRLVQERIVGSARYQLDEIVWASKEGWLVARAQRDGRVGYLWLFPVRK